MTVSCEVWLRRREAYLNSHLPIEVGGVADLLNRLRGRRDETNQLLPTDSAEKAISEWLWVHLSACPECWYVLQWALLQEMADNTTLRNQCLIPGALMFHAGSLRCWDGGRQCWAKPHHRQWCELFRLTRRERYPHHPRQLKPWIRPELPTTVHLPSKPPPVLVLGAD